MKKLLIVGIDPGTTIGYSILDLEGNLIEIGSEKNLSFSSLISIIINQGIPVIFSCDVTPAPSFVQKLAIKTGAKLIRPRKNLSVKEKRDLTSPFKEKVNNIHESDSLAAALFGFKEIKTLLRKIDVALKNKKELLYQVREIVIKQEIPIKEVIDILEKPKEDTKILKKVIEKREFSQKDFFILYNKLKRADNDIRVLQKQNKNLIEELNKKPKIKIPRQKTDEKLLFKEIIIQKLDKKLEEKEEDIKKLNKQIFELNSCFADLNSNYLLKKLDNLSYQHFNIRNKLFNIQEDDVLFVDDLTIHSKKTIEGLREMVKIIIYNKSTKKILNELPFTFIDAKKLTIKQTDLFAFVSRFHLDKEISKQDILSKIVTEYRKSKLHHN